MKRFGLPVLLSAIYVTAMFFVFSSDYGKENTFLFPDVNQEISDFPPKEGSQIVPPSPEIEESLKVTLSAEEEDPEEDTSANNPVVYLEQDHHSPEGPDGE